MRRVLIFATMAAFWCSLISIGLARGKANYQVAGRQNSGNQVYRRQSRHRDEPARGWTGNGIWPRSGWGGQGMGFGRGAGGGGPAEDQVQDAEQVSGGAADEAWAWAWSRLGLGTRGWSR